MSVVVNPDHFASNGDGEDDLVVAPWIRLKAVNDRVDLHEISTSQGVIDRTSLSTDNRFEHSECLWLPSDLLEWNSTFAPPASFQARLNLTNEIGVRQHPPKHRLSVLVSCFAFLHRCHDVLHAKDKRAAVSLPVSHAHSSQRHNAQFSPAAQNRREPLLDAVGHKGGAQR